MAALMARYRRRACPLVPADDVRAHVCELATKGLGTEHQARQAGVSLTTVHQVRHGRLQRVRSSTATKILSIRPVLAQGQRVSASEPWELTYALIEEGYDRREVAKRLGMQTGKLQWARGDGARVTVRTVLRVRGVAKRLLGEEAES
jgi:hypothetical protein